MLYRVFADVAELADAPDLGERVGQKATRPEIEPSLTLDYV